MLFHKNKAKNKEDKEVNAEVARIKEQKAVKHAHSKIRHPVKASKHAVDNAKQSTAHYKELGRERAIRQLHHKPTEYYVPDKELFQYWSKNTSVGKKVVALLAIACVIGFIALGALS